MASPAPPIPDLTCFVSHVVDQIEAAKVLVRDGIPVSEHAEYAATVIDGIFVKILGLFSNGTSSSKPKSNTGLLGFPAILSPVRKIPMFLAGPHMQTPHTSRPQPMTSTPRPDRPRFVSKASYRPQFPKFPEDIEIITLEDSDEENDSAPTDAPQPNKQAMPNYSPGSQPFGNTPVSQFYPEQPLPIIPRSFVNGRSVLFTLQQLSDGGPPMVKVPKHDKSAGTSLFKRSPDPPSKTFSKSSMAPVKLPRTGFMPKRSELAFPAVIKKAQVIAKENLNPRAGNVPSPTENVSKNAASAASNVACGVTSTVQGERFMANTRRPKMVICPERNCGKSIRSSYSGQHQLAHQKFKPFRCIWKNGPSGCPFKTKYRSNIREHIKNVHLKGNTPNLVNNYIHVATNVPEQPEEN